MTAFRSMVTKVLTCEPGSISFTASSQPLVSSSDTLASLQEALHDLVSLKRPIVFPTETVYGLAAPALCSSAVSLIFSIKGRPPDNPLIVHVSSIEMLHSLLPPSFSMPPTYTALIDAFWPGPLTLLFPTSPQIPSIVTASHHTVAIRMPSHPVARALIALADTPLAAPSANTSGTPSPTKAEHVFRDLSGKVRVILNGGPCQVGVESTVVDGLASDGNLRVLRPGGVTVEALKKVLAAQHLSSRVFVHKRDYQDQTIEQAPTTPGMKYRHYSPSVPVILLMTSPPTNGEEPGPLSDVLSTVISPFSCSAPIRIGFLAPSDSPLSCLPTRLHAYAQAEIQWNTFPLGPIGDPSFAAQRLFDGLLTLEERGVDLIIVEGIDETHEGLAVMNRIRKAASAIHWITMDRLTSVTCSNSVVGDITRSTLFRSLNQHSRSLFLR